MKDRTVLITGASRGIGRAIALRLAREGANIVVAAKSDRVHPKLGGSIHETAAAVEAAGGRALAVVLDVRNEAQVAAAIAAAVAHFGGLDAVINNAGAINLTNVENTPVRRYDLMQSVNARAVFVCAQAALPHLKKAAGRAHVLSLCPPLNLHGPWLREQAPYTLSKMGMTLLSLGMAAEFAPLGIAVNCLWPRTLIATAAVEFAIPGGKALFARSRRPEIVADAAFEILRTPATELTGQCLLDEDFLRSRGVTDFAPYAYDPAAGQALLPDFFV
ncbi:MAG: NAD(P)-dependent oxidoreductase [Verrucomicrobia bacterium]|nr:NAD(P)-dependent oxidoreductase [Verrucomicrobiota bacterium]MBV9658952.1 NAD(P)-dependent oxidoreductase [Verrucomicrobiota bacterium]